MGKIIRENKVYDSVKQACRENGISYNSVYDYKKRKMVSEQAAFDYYVANKPVARIPYTEEELTVMRELADAGFSSSVAARILNRPVKSVRKKAVECKISFHSTRKFTAEELQWVFDNFDTHTYKDMAKALSCCISTLEYRGKRLGLVKRRASEKVSVVRTLAGKKTAREIGEQLGLNEKAVRIIAAENKISLACPEKSGRKPWSEQEDDILRMYHSLSES